MDRRQSRPGTIVSRRPAARATLEASQRIGPLAILPKLLRQLGVEPEQIVAAAGVEIDALRDPEGKIPYAVMGRVLRECADATGCAYFGLLAGQQMQLSQLGLPGEMARNSPTLGEALQTFFVYHHLNSQGGVWVLSEHDGLTSASYAIYEEGLVGSEQIYDGVVALAFNVIRELCGPGWLPEMVLFSRAKPGEIGPYRRFFQAPMRFDSERTAVVFRARWLQQPVRGADPNRLRMLEEQAQVENPLDFTNRLHRSVRELLLSGKAAGQELATLLSMHKRTLNRRLKAQGTTFQCVLERTRFEVARELLDNTRAPMLDIATSLGYTDASSFSRAYRRWSGTRPSQSRQSKPD